LGVTLTDPENIKLFNDRVHKARQALNIPNQIFWLEQRAIDNLFDQDDALLFERLLEQDDQLQEKYKLQMRKKYAGHVQYSAIIGKEDRKEIHLWKMVLNRLQ
jgi:anaerobic ribonucleoside-triphosphate reductase